MTALPKSEQLAELGLAREDHLTSMSVGTYPDGTVVTLLQLGSGTMMYYPATLGQAIQLRDFLNRHIDELALKQTGSLAERASDDPTQLAAVEEVPLQRHTESGTGATWLEPGRVPQPGEGCGKPIIRGRVHLSMHCGESLEGTKRLCNECTARAGRSV